MHCPHVVLKPISRRELLLALVASEHQAKVNSQAMSSQTTLAAEILITLVAAERNIFMFAHFVRFQQIEMISCKFTLVAKNCFLGMLSLLVPSHFFI